MRIARVRRKVYEDHVKNLERLHTFSVHFKKNISYRASINIPDETSEIRKFGSRNCKW